MNLKMIGTVLLLNLSLAESQNNAPSPRPEFEVASVKLNTSGDKGMALRPFPGGRLTAQNAPLRLLIQNAYSVKPFQIVGGPDWIDSNHYDIAAKAEANPSPTEMLSMLQILLEKRFKLALHSETRELPVYNLVVARKGKLSESREGTCPPPTPVGPGRQPAAPCGRVAAMLSPAGGRLVGKKASMAQLAFTLGNILGQPVIDKTGFNATFDVDLDFNRDDAIDPERPTAPRSVPSAESGVPSIFTSLQERLGLKLESAKGLVPVLIIDHAEKPSEN